jgi:hypothetical protein
VLRALRVEPGLSLAPSRIYPRAMTSNTPGANSPL